MENVDNRQTILCEVKILVSLLLKLYLFMGQDIGTEVRGQLVGTGVL